MSPPEHLVDQRVVPDGEDAARRERFPLGAGLTLEDLEMAGREGLLDELRATEPVTWMPALGGWLLAAREPARQVLARGSGATVESHQNMVRASLGRMMLTVDGDEHERMRTPFEQPFRGSTVRASFEEPITALVGELIDAFAAEGEAEVDSAFAAPFAVRMAGDALGLPLDDVARIDGFYAAFADAMEYDGDPEPPRRAAAARAELDAILLDELARYRVEPSGHSITAMLARDSAGLTDEEVAAQLRVVMFGAIETMQASVLSTLVLLLGHPEQLAQVGEDPDLLGPAQEEARRLIPPVAFMERWTREPMTLGEVEVPAGEFVGMSVVGINRDPAVFDDPLRFDVHRPHLTKAMGFSFGPHACLGIHLARLQTTIALRALLERLPELALVSADPAHGFAFRRPTSVRVRWNA